MPGLGHTVTAPPEATELAKQLRAFVRYIQGKKERYSFQLDDGCATVDAAADRIEQLEKAAQVHEEDRRQLAAAERVIERISVWNPVDGEDARHWARRNYLRLVRKGGE
jgi:hypothetical protein